MATDLSKLIQDSFTLTINGLLAKDAKILKITKAHIRDLEDIQIYKIDSLFNFSTLSSKFSFLIPAKSASILFNTMMGSPITDLANEYDDDTEDAIGEFISNTSGSLTTEINALDLEDIGQTKFNISHKELLQGEDVTNLENTYRFKIELEDHELILFIGFEEEILPFIPEIANSEVTFYEPRKEPQDEEEIIEEIISANEQNQNDEVTTPDDDTNEEKPAPKDIKLKKIIIIVASLLGFIILIFFILFFSGFFEQETVEETTIQRSLEPKTLEEEIPLKNDIKIVEYTTIKKVIFNSSEIDRERLNNRLSELTKYKVLNKKQLEAQKLAEKNRLFEQRREKELLAFSKRNHEETVFEEKELSLPVIVDKKTTLEEEVLPKQPSNIVIPKENRTSTKLHYVMTNSLKYSLFKSLVQETTTSQARISICNNTNGKTTIYIGPFETETLQKTMIDLVQNNDIQIDISLANITEQEFNMRCNLE